MCIARLDFVGALLVCSLLGISAPILAQEPLPTPPQPEVEDQSSLTTRRDFYCPTFDNRPLTALTVDVRPVDPEGELVADTDLPANCMPAPATETDADVLGLRPRLF